MDSDQTNQSKLLLCRLESSGLHCFCGSFFIDYFNLYQNTSMCFITAMTPGTSHRENTERSK